MDIKQLYENKHYDQIIELLTTNNSGIHLEAETRFYLGLSYFKTGNNANGIEVMTQVIHEDPSNPKAYFERGTAYLNEGLFKQAKTDLDKAIELEPNYHEAITNKAILHYELEEYDLSAKCFDQAILLSPDANNYYCRGNLYHTMNLTGKAIEDYTRSFAIYKKNKNQDSVFNISHLMNNLGLLFIQSAEYRKAIDVLSKLISYEAENLTTYLYRAHSYRKLKAFELAEIDIHAAIDLDSDNVDVLLEHAWLLLDTKQYAFALEVTDFIIKIADPLNPKALSLSAEIKRHL